MPRRPYSLAGAVLGRDRELAVSEELASRHGALQTRGGVLIPPEHVFPGPRAALEAGTATAGEELLFEFPGPRGAARQPIPRVAQLGATIITDAPGTLRIVRVTDGGGLVWMEETPGADVSLEDMTFGSETVDLFLGARGISWTRQLETQGQGTSALVEREIRSAAASAVDTAAVNGQGSGSNQPEGLLVRSDIPEVAIGANGGAPTYALLTEMEEDPSGSDVEERSSGWLTTPGVRRKLRDTETFSGSGAPVWPLSGRFLLGHPAFVSNVVPSDLTKGTGTNLHAILYGAEWPALVVHLLAVELVVDKITRTRQGIVEAVLFVHVGIGVTVPEAFVRVVDADVS